MNIEITDTEYRYLLDMLHMADIVMTGHRKEEDSRTERHRALIQKLYGLARGAGFERMIGYDENVKKYIPTEEFEHGALPHVVMDEFGGHLFWDLLISRLTERDAAQMAGGIDRLRAMNSSDRQFTEEHIRQRYIEEFAANGVQNLEIVERFGSGGGTPITTSD
jgi:hypothetical protein